LLNGYGADASAAVGELVPELEPAEVVPFPAVPVPVGPITDDELPNG
jgi:hypothetical protein